MACRLDGAKPLIVMSLPTGITALQWRYNEHKSVSNHQPHHCILRVTGFCAGNSPVTGIFPAQMASNAENVSIWWRHHDLAHRDRMTYTCANSNSIQNFSLPLMYTPITRQHLRCVTEENHYTAQNIFRSLASVGITWQASNSKSDISLTRCRRTLKFCLIVCNKIFWKIRLLS